MKQIILCFLLFWGIGLSLFAVEPAFYPGWGDWTVRIDPKEGSNEWTVDKVETVSVTVEKYDQLPMFNAKGAEYARGLKLHQIKAQECPTAYAADPNSIVVRETQEKNSLTYELGKDYQIEPKWGCLGRIPDSRIAENQPVYIDYVYGKMRIDSIVRTKDGKLTLKKVVPCDDAFPAGIRNGSVKVL